MLSEEVELVEPPKKSVVVGTGKGGVGKSTVGAHLAAHCAEQGERTLLVCVTSQDDDDLGIKEFGRGVQPDGLPVMDGQGLYRSISERIPLVPVRDVRPNLDVVPGGVMVGELVPLLMARLMGHDGPGVVLSLARALQPIALFYDRIVFDSAPENDSLEQLALAAGRHLFVPTRSDASSIRGMGRIARNFKVVRRQANPWLRVAGAFLYASNPTAVQLHAQVKEDIRATLGDGTPILSTIVGYREKPAVNARRKGLLFNEYAELLPKSAKSYDVAAGRARVEDVVPEAIVGLAADMRQLNLEILDYSKKAAE
ncbi:ParA family protein [Streptomyces sp. NPDC056534]|uniref:ParA family protein n=1 Tax=Streptomyces sp. NPDC056534 TaxID=3345857 RepID=UPI0036B62F4D